MKDRQSSIAYVTWHAGLHGIDEDDTGCKMVACVSVESIISQLEAALPN